MAETRAEKAVSWIGWALLIIMALLMILKIAGVL